MNTSADLLRDIIRSVKNKRFLQKSSGIQKDCQKALLSLVEVSQEMCNNGMGNKSFGDFLIEQAKILKEIGGNYKKNKPWQDKT